MNFSNFLTHESVRPESGSAKGLKKRLKGYRGSGLLLILTAVLLFAGCIIWNNVDDTGFIPTGTWISYDSYTITKNSVDYFMDGSEWDGVVYPPTILKGSIEKAVDFPKNSGVLIIKITDATYNTVDKYTGIYYREYTKSSIKLATAYSDGVVEADSLAAALKLFTVDKESSHVLTYGTYTK